MSLRYSQFFVAENVWLQGGEGAPEPPSSYQMPYHLKFELEKPDIFDPMFVNRSTGCREKDILDINLWC